MAIWSGVGSSLVANMEGVENGSSIGPSSSGEAELVEVNSSPDRAIHELALLRGAAETDERGMVRWGRQTEFERWW